MTDSTNSPRALVDRLVGQRIAYRRGELRITEAQLAGLLGIAVSTIKEVESGDHRPTPQLIDALASALDIAPSWLFDGPVHRFD